MTTKFFLPLTLGITLLLTSCSSGAEDEGHSTPIDSTNSMGVPPVQYGAEAGTPLNDSTASRDSATLNNKFGNQNNAAGGTTGQGGVPPAGNGTNTSNTTDRRTTSGSANAGDADGDRKK